MKLINQRKSFMRRISLKISAVLVILITAGFGFVQYNHHIIKPIGSSKSLPATHLLTSASGRYWIINSHALSKLLDDSSAKQTLQNDTIFITGYNNKQPINNSEGLHLIPTEGFTSEAILEHAIQTKSIKSGVKAILYDNEDWSLTPKQEQANPVSYYQKASSIAKTAGYIFIGSPVSKIDKQIDQQIASLVDVLDIQSQYDQKISSIYAAHVNPIAISARSVNNKLVILAGLSTNPPAGIPTAQELLNDATAVSHNVQGYWLNVPTPGIGCPKCNQQQPEIGIEFLKLLGSS